MRYHSSVAIATPACALTAGSLSCVRFQNWQSQAFVERSRGPSGSVDQCVREHRRIGRTP